MMIIHVGEKKKTLPEFYRPPKGSYTPEKPLIIVVKNKQKGMSGGDK